ncbi:MAG: helix-turn-helix domain-containing protein [Sphingobium sp.]
MERIVEAARTCFERYGIRKTTIEDIATAAGVSRPTVYKHFPSKQQIVEHISLAEMAKVHDTLRARMTRQASFADTVTEAVLLSVEAGGENPYVRRFVQDVELSARSQEPDSLFQVEARARWMHVLERAQASGELATDIDMEQTVAWLSLSQMMLLSTRARLGIADGELRHFIRRFVVEPLLEHRGA